VILKYRPWSLCAPPLLPRLSSKKPSHPPPILLSYHQRKSVPTQRGHTGHSLRHFAISRVHNLLPVRPRRPQFGDDLPLCRHLTTCHCVLFPILRNHNVRDKWDGLCIEHEDFEQTVYSKEPTSRKEWLSGYLTIFGSEERSHLSSHTLGSPPFQPATYPTTGALLVNVSLSTVFLKMSWGGRKAAE